MRIAFKRSRARSFKVAKDLVQSGSDQRGLGRKNRGKFLEWAKAPRNYNIPRFSARAQQSDDPGVANTLLVAFDRASAQMHDFRPRAIAGLAVTIRESE